MQNFLWLLLFLPYSASTDFCEGVDEGWMQSVNDFKQQAVKEYGQTIEHCSSEYGFSKSILFGILMTENVGLKNNYVHEETQATGVFQMIPATQELVKKNSDMHLEADLTDRRVSAQYACGYFRFMRNVEHIDDTWMRVVGYNVGHNGVQKLTYEKVLRHPYRKKVQCAMKLMSDTIQFN